MADTGTRVGGDNGVGWRVAKTGPAVREALSPGLRERFEVEFRVALDVAEGNFDVDAVQHVVDRWWPRALLCANPDVQEGIDTDRRRLERGDTGVLGATTTPPHAAAG